MFQKVCQHNIYIHVSSLFLKILQLRKHSTSNFSDHFFIRKANKDPNCHKIPFFPVPVVNFKMTYFVQTALSNNSAITKIIGTGLRFNKPVYLCQGWPTF